MQQPDALSPVEVNLRVCRALGIDPARCVGVTLEFKAGQIPKAVATMHIQPGTVELLELLAAQISAGAMPAGKVEAGGS